MPRSRRTRRTQRRRPRGRATNCPSYMFVGTALSNVTLVAGAAIADYRYQDFGLPMTISKWQSASAIVSLNEVSPGVAIQWRDHNSTGGELISRPTLVTFGKTSSVRMSNTVSHDIDENLPTATIFQLLFQSTDVASTSTLSVRVVVRIRIFINPITGTIVPAFVGGERTNPVVAPSDYTTLGSSTIFKNSTTIHPSDVKQIMGMNSQPDNEYEFSKN
jgi:hypothetical protein